MKKLATSRKSAAKRISQDGKISMNEPESEEIDFAARLEQGRKRNWSVENLTMNSLRIIDAKTGAIKPLGMYDDLKLTAGGKARNHSKDD